MQGLNNPWLIRKKAVTSAEEANGAIKRWNPSPLSYLDIVCDSACKSRLET